MKNITIKRLLDKGTAESAAFTLANDLKTLFEGSGRVIIGLPDGTYVDHEGVPCAVLKTYPEQIIEEGDESMSLSYTLPEWVKIAAHFGEYLYANDHPVTSELLQQLASTLGMILLVGGLVPERIEVRCSHNTWTKVNLSLATMSKEIVDDDEFATIAECAQQALYYVPQGDAHHHRAS